jgi:trimethylamine--corrinoid protein Co-methyltransferase
MGYDVAKPFFSMLSAEQCGVIHRASLEILRRTGVRVFHPEALKLLRSADTVISDDNLVHFSPGLVEWALAQAPSRIALCRRGGSEVIANLEGREVSFGTGSDCLSYQDPRTGQHRPPTVSDLVDCIRLVDALPELSFCMSMLIPMDLNKANVYRNQAALMLQNTTKPFVFVCDDRADCEAIVAMASAAAGGMENLRMNPSILLYSEPSSPLRQSETAIGKLLYMAEQGLPLVHSPAPVQGGTAPVTLAGALAQANAEVLSALVIHQLKRPGAPMVYGCGMHHLDMKTMAGVYGGPEFQLARVAVAEMGRYYGMPTWGYAGDSDSCVVDEQSAAEATFSIMTALLAGNNLTHDVGYIEQGLTTSPEMILFAAEIISELRRFAEGIALDEESMAMEVIHQVGSSHDYLATDHTLKNFRVLWQPKRFTRLRYEAWLKKGGKPMGQRLREQTVALMDGHVPQPLPNGVQQEVAYILEAN